MFFNEIKTKKTKEIRIGIITSCPKINIESSLHLKLIIDLKLSILFHI